MASPRTACDRLSDSRLDRPPLAGVGWVKIGRRPMSDADAVNLLKLTVIVGPVCSLIVLFWALVLFRYGDANAQGHVMLFIGVTLVGWTFCMMHLRAAALLITAVTNIPFAIFFLTTGRPIFLVMVLGMLLVSAAMVLILSGFARDHARMIEYQRARR